MRKKLFLLADALEAAAYVLRFWHRTITITLLVLLMEARGLYEGGIDLSTLDSLDAAKALFVLIWIISGFCFCYLHMQRMVNSSHPPILGVFCGWLAGNAAGSLLLFFVAKPIWMLEVPLSLLYIPVYTAIAAICQHFSNVFGESADRMIS